ncbi:MAG TPA: phage tail tape measure protein [Chryseosolibacter sp.]|nr:phage tail tape measure protein [Chryseosolibacter sp.]
MSAGNKLQTDLILNIAANSAELRQALDSAKGQVSKFSAGIKQIGGMIAGAFAVGSIVAAGKQVFEFSQKIGELRNKLQSLGLEGQTLVDATAKAKAISETFNLDFDKLLESARAVSKEMGIGIPQALDMIRDGYAQTGSEEFLDMLREYPAQFATVGATADEAFAVITQSINEGIYSDKGADAIKEAGLRLREMTPATRDALTAIGISSEEIQSSIANGSLTTFQAIQKVSQKLAGFKDDSKQVGQVLADVFGGAGEDAGIRFVKMLGDANLSFADMTNNVNETVKAQLHLTQANEDLNKVWVQMFGGSSTMWTELKADLIDIAVVAIRGIVKGTVDMINYFIDLYNKSMLFRYSIEQVVFWFKNLWDVIKLVGKNIYDVFSSAGQLISAVFKGEFEKIPMIYATAMQNVLTNSLEFATGIGQNFKEGIDNVLRAEPIELITLDEAEQQGKGAAAVIKKEIKNATSSFKLEMPKPDAASFSMNDLQGGTDIKSENKEAVLFTPKNEQEFQSFSDWTDVMTWKSQELGSAWAGFGSQFSEVIGTTAVGALDTLGAAMVGMNTEAEASFAGLVKGMLNGIKKIIQGLLAQAIAGAVAKEVGSKGVFGLVTAAIAVAGVTALFNAIPAFQDGGIVPRQQGLSMVGEQGAELVSLPAGSRVFNHGQSMRMLDQAGSKGIVADVKVKGEDLYLVFKEVERRRK